MHLIIKFHHFSWNQNDKSLLTIPEHEKILAENGKVYWGRVTSISPSKAEELNSQIAEGKKTYAFLYATQVPQSVHPDKNLWYIAEVSHVHIGAPTEKNLIPEYYREGVQIEVAFLFKSIKPIHFKPKTTPKVPGQASIRYCVLKGSAIPENLYSYTNPEQLIINTNQDDQTPELQTEDTIIKSVNLHSDTEEVDYKSDLIDAQNDIIELQNEIINLREYKELYKKILDTDYLFSSEKFLETWLHENIHRLMPELEIIDQQPTASWPDGQFGRLDLLAKNKETKDIAIIEVKTRKRKIKSGYDQFLRYTSWVRRFKNEITSKYKAHDLKVTDTPSFIIITDYTTNEMEAICRDHGITLIKVFGGLGFEKVA